MIKVGIQENLRLLSTEKNDKGTLTLTVLQDSGGGGSEADALNSSSTNASDNENTYMFWPMKAYESETDDVKIGTQLYNEILNLRSKLNHILEQFMTEKDVKWDVLKGVNAPNGVKAGLIDSGTRDAIVSKIYDNYADQFVAQLTPHIGPSSPLFRMKLARQSKDKSFSTLPKFPSFIEPMSIPANQSKLAWSPYELGFRKGDPAGKPSAWSQADPTQAAGDNASGGNPAETEAVTNLFGGATA